MRGKTIDRGRIRVRSGAIVMAIKPLGGAEIRLPTNIWMEYSQERQGSGATVNHPGVGMVYMKKPASKYRSVEVKMYSRTEWMSQKGREGVFLGGAYKDSFYNGESERRPFKAKKLWSDA